MLTLRRQPPLPFVPSTRKEHDWTDYARSKAQGAFPARRSHRLCRRCGVVCRPDTEFAACVSETPLKKDGPC